MKKVLLFIDSLVSGGAQRQIVGLAKLLHDKKYEVKLIYYHPLEFYKPYLDENGVTYECVPGASYSQARFFKIAKSIREFKPDVVISYLDVPIIISCLLKACGMKFKLIVSERNTTQTITLRDRVKFFLMRWADVIVPNSYTQEKFIKEHYYSLKNKVVTITNFVDTEMFVPSINKSNQTTRIVVVGRVSEQKNILRFLKVIKILKDRDMDFVVDWYGYTAEPYNSQCKKITQKYEIGDVFSFHNPTLNIISEYQDCDVFCLPSIYEGFPNVICEAMSCGKPILCSNICDNPMIVKDNYNVQWNFYVPINSTFKTE